MSEPVPAFKVDLPMLKHPASVEHIADFLTVYAGLSPAQISAAVLEKFPHLSRELSSVDIYAITTGWISGQMQAAAVALRELTPARRDVA